MIQAGKNITSKEDQLQKIKVEYLYHKIKNPDPEIASKIRQLRIIRLIDSKQYSVLKRQLPYVVCGIFNPPYRNSENFGYTEYFMIDIDHISEKEISLTELKTKIIQDKRVVLCFISPGEDGLKILFRLKERCYDAGVYSIFYKLFIMMFAKQYQIEQVIDVRTSDVTRACFLSIDENVYFNSEAEVVEMENFVKPEDTSELFKMSKQIEKELPKPVLLDANKDFRVPDEEAMFKIKSLLNPALLAKIEKREAYVPEELNMLIDLLIPYIENSGVFISGIENIHYGKKMKFRSGLKEAEINVFYGKKGFSVVISPRRGTNDEFNSLMSQLVEQFLYQGGE